MQDLNDLFYFAKVVEHGGFMAASRVLGIPKSRLSRRVADLETRLGVRLLHRTTRRLALTAIGGNVYQHCQAMLAEATAAEELVERVTAEPRGLIRVSCPELLSKVLLGPILPRFLAGHPKVRLHLESTNRRVDLIEEGVDVAIRVRNVLEDNASLVARPLGATELVLVASPTLIEHHGTPSSPAALSAWPCLTMIRPNSTGEWVLRDDQGKTIQLTIEAPRLVTDDLQVLRDATLAGCGIAALPRFLCEAFLADGRLIRLFPDYDIPYGILHAVFPTRRGLSPAVRVFIDFLVEHLVPDNAPGYRRL
ncbi:LysR substrate-binding domain-containing protein [Paludibacterium paludis]|uniref:Transcriptional regulator n=1 Tax=Paludibacterium paludis TaxID=1225769 RepID=A0A918P3J9_9NEIS|nr:LysR substrate-binding domain-containing protein [Paludibacterium paludis]GGY16902.1 transcriptional regulator [Paludibacterium paludis]